MKNRIFYGLCKKDKKTRREKALVPNFDPLHRPYKSLFFLNHFWHVGHRDIHKTFLFEFFTFVNMFKMYYKIKGAYAPGSQTAMSEPLATCSLIFKKLKNHIKISKRCEHKSRYRQCSATNVPIFNLKYHKFGAVQKMK
jgi:hypothetical protein